MKWPRLVKSFAMTEALKLAIDAEELDEYGDPVTTLTWEGKCSWQDGAQITMQASSGLFRHSAEVAQRYVNISGRALIDGDIAPEVPNLSGGYGWIHGQRRAIAEINKWRNPDGTVNYTEVIFT